MGYTCSIRGLSLNNQKSLKQKLSILFLLLIVNVCAYAQYIERDTDPITGDITNCSFKINFTFASRIDMDTNLTSNHTRYNAIIGCEIGKNGEGRMFVSSNNRTQTKKVYSIEFAKEETFNGCKALIFTLDNGHTGAALLTDQTRVVKQFTIWDTHTRVGVLYYK